MDGVEWKSEKVECKVEAVHGRFLLVAVVVVAVSIPTVVVAVISAKILSEKVVLELGYKVGEVLMHISDEACCGRRGCSGSHVDVNVYHLGMVQGGRSSNC